MAEFPCDGLARRGVDPPPRPRERSPRRAARRRRLPTRDLFVPLEGIRVSKSVHAVQARVPCLALVDLQLLLVGALRARSRRGFPPDAAPRRAARAARRGAPALRAVARPWSSTPSGGCTPPRSSRAGVNLIASSLRSPNAASRRSAIATCGSFTRASLSGSRDGAPVLVGHVLAVGDAELAVGGDHTRAADPLRPPANVRGAVLHRADGPSLALPLLDQRHDVLAPEPGRPKALETELRAGCPRSAPARRSAPCACRGSRHRAPSAGA